MAVKVNLIKKARQVVIFLFLKTHCRRKIYFLQTIKRGEWFVVCFLWKLNSQLTPKIYKSCISFILLFLCNRDFESNKLINGMLNYSQKAEQSYQLFFWQKVSAVSCNQASLLLNFKIDYIWYVCNVFFLWTFPNDLSDVWSHLF